MTNHLVSIHVDEDGYFPLGFYKLPKTLPVSETGTNISEKTVLTHQGSQLFAFSVGFLCYEYPVKADVVNAFILT